MALTKMTKQEKEPYFYPKKPQVLISPMSTSLAILAEGQPNSICKYHVWQTKVLLSFPRPQIILSYYTHTCQWQATVVSQHTFLPIQITKHPEHTICKHRMKLCEQTTALRSHRCKLKPPLLSPRGKEKGHPHGACSFPEARTILISRHDDHPD